MVTFLPQVIKIQRTKRAGVIYMLTLLLMLASYRPYVVYGILLNIYPGVIMLGVMTCMVIMKILLTVEYNSAQQAGQRDAFGARYL